MNSYEFRNVRGHVEVFLHGSFILSADTMAEARREIENDYSDGEAA